jgi:hypothetical protein
MGSTSRVAGAVSPATTATMDPAAIRSVGAPLLSMGPRSSTTGRNPARRVTATTIRADGRASAVTSVMTDLREAIPRVGPIPRSTGPWSEAMVRAPAQLATALISREAPAGSAVSIAMTVPADIRLAGRRGTCTVRWSRTSARWSAAIAMAPIITGAGAVYPVTSATTDPADIRMVIVPRHVTAETPKMDCTSVPFVTGAISGETGPK